MREKKEKEEKKKKRNAVVDEQNKKKKKSRYLLSRQGTPTDMLVTSDLMHLINNIFILLTLLSIFYLFSTHLTSF